MEWSKAKNILILTFLALNIFLGYSLWKEANLLFPARLVTHQEMEEAEEYLKAVNLELKVSPSRQIFYMPLLTVENNPPELDSLLNSLFNGEVGLPSPDNFESDPQVYRQEGKELLLWSKGRVEFSQEVVPPAGEEEMDTEEALLRAQEFLENRDLFPSDARVEEIIELEDDRYLVIFNQVYTNQALYGGSLRVHIAPGGVKGFEKYWLNPQGFSGQDINTISAPSALISLAENLVPFSEKKEIISVNIGYYTEALDAQRWDMVPVWRIKIADQGIYFINAYTGELEGRVDY
ncbi:MAG: hypothetical protein D5R97_03790 [Candidatus Syntrophonatronum acetioxidans]|uniref:Regulatory protein YycH-like domain-containing protein n=1 Tax=Candidatus Syntrophonatronum acetioxidans TaxID=1795816 RepID=A0A424YFV0_9FIRM|nr:MAG: hypothetical protein D5R97_03790 [Candidatus Syntrophonatronum acetioxidans]